MIAFFKHQFVLVEHLTKGNQQLTEKGFVCYESNQKFLNGNALFPEDKQQLHIKIDYRLEHLPIEVKVFNSNCNLINPEKVFAQYLQCKFFF